MLHVVERRSLSCSRPAGNGRKSPQSNEPFLVHPGPLPEPVINGEMEEKVRALTRKNTTIKADICSHPSAGHSALEPSLAFKPESPAAPRVAHSVRFNRVLNLVSCDCPPVILWCSVEDSTWLVVHYVWIMSVFNQGQSQVLWKYCLTPVKVFKPPPEQHKMQWGNTWWLGAGDQGVTLVHSQVQTNAEL